MLRHVLAFALLASATTNTIFAQEFRATLSGRVTDPSGASVPGAMVIATKSDTGSRSQTKTDNAGLYSLPLLPPGLYSLTAESKGFKKYVQNGLTLGTDQKVSQDIVLAIGESSQSVVVTADASVLEGTTASTGQVISTREVENLPVNGRSAMTLAYLGFGVISNEARDQERPFENAGLSNQAIGGAAGGANEMLLDGIPNTGTTGQSGLRVAYSPPMDAVAEVKVDTFNVDAAYGRSGGGTISIVTKGGTNLFHGSAYEYNQTSAMNATPFFTNAAGGKKTVSAQNSFGGSIGGPVIIPKVFNGKNKLFFFFSYEKWLDRAPNPSFFTVPTAAERTGDFSGIATKLYDPNSAVATGTTITRTALFPGNVIPASRLNPVAMNYLKLLPAGNTQGNPDGTNNFFVGLSTLQNYSSYNYRGDYNISDRNKLNGSFHSSLWKSDSAQQFGIASGETAYRETSGATIDDVHTFTPTLVGDLRIGYSRYRPYYTQFNIGYDATQLGFPSYITSNATVPQIPQINFNDNFTQIAGGHQTNQPLNTYQVLGVVTKILGKHSLKAGAEMRKYQFSQVNWTAAAGSFTFDNTWVKQTSTTSSTSATGTGLASFLLGLPSSGSYTFNAFSTQDEYYSAAFLNDDWRVKSNVTVNIGLRWEYSSPSEERYNRQAGGFNPTAVNSTTTAAQAAYAANYAAYPNPKIPVSAFSAAGGIFFSTSDNRDSYQTPKNSVAPRLGISWTPEALHQKTVIRSGIGIFYYPYPVVTQPQPGYTYTNSFVATNNSYLTPAATLSNPFPQGLVQAPGNSNGVNTSLGQSVSFYNPNLLNEYSLRWDLDIQHQLGKNLLLEVGYTGNHSVHLATSQSLGALPAQYLSTLPVRDTANINALGATVANPFAGLLPGQSNNGTTTSLSNLLRAYPQFSGVTENYVGNGSSFFHQFAFRAQKRYENGLQFLVNYQHSRLMEKNSYLNNNPGAFNLERRVSASDRPNRLASSVSYELPFGKGRRFLGNANWLVNGVIGGWSTAVIQTFQSGAPLAWGNVIYYGGNLNYNPRNISHAFDITQFNLVSAQQLSNNLRTFPTQFNNLRVDTTHNWDVNVSKAFPIYERLKLVYRAEAFNLTNRAQFSAATLTPTSNTFGQISSQSNLPRAIQMSLRLVF